MESELGSDVCVSEAPHAETREQSLLQGRTCVCAQMKERQSSKIKELGDTLLSAGFLSLDEQAKALAVSRSTTWTILKGGHKASGLTASVINRMLAAPQLPPLVRRKILEYVEEKSAGLYGGSSAQQRRFAARLSIKGVGRVVHEETGPQTSRGQKSA